MTPSEGRGSIAQGRRRTSKVDDLFWKVFRAPARFSPPGSQPESGTGPSIAMSMKILDPAECHTACLGSDKVVQQDLQWRVFLERL